MSANTVAASPASATVASATMTSATMASATMASATMASATMASATMASATVAFATVAFAMLTFVMRVAPRLGPFTRHDGRVFYNIIAWSMIEGIMDQKIEYNEEGVILCSHYHMNSLIAAVLLIIPSIPKLGFYLSDSKN
ncbi:hypothetical protein NW752_000905 [Fusarium irregulare]|nr:hypothetical protein NW752_000905 [Fusarium irregulare]